MQCELVFPDRFTPSLLILKERSIDHTFYHFVTPLLFFLGGGVVVVGGGVRGQIEHMLQHLYFGSPDLMSYWCCIEK